MSYITKLVNEIRDGIQKRNYKRKFYSSIKSTDVFLVTYPRSGTTWSSFLIANVIVKNANEELNLKNYEKYIPAINANYFYNAGTLEQYSYLKSPRILLTHAPYDAKFQKVIYIVRDPRDLMISYWHYNKYIKADFNQSLKEFVSDSNHWPCEWDTHVSGWLLEHQHPNLLMIKYEEMHRDTINSLKTILDFAKISYSQNDLQRSMALSQFDNMRSLEEQNGINSEKYNPDEYVIRRGKVGSWKDELDDECLEIIEHRYGATMKKLGYETVIVG